MRAPGGSFLGKSTFADELQEHPELEVSFITATPRMARYLEYSTQIYDIYLRYLAPEDIHVYSIDEVFLDVTQYLKIYKMTARRTGNHDCHRNPGEKGTDRHGGDRNKSVSV